MARRTHDQVVADTTREFVNLRRTLKSMENKGATLSPEQQAIVDTKPSEFKKGDINAQVERQLLGIRKRIGKDAMYENPETGEVMRWGDYQKERRSASARQGARTRKRLKEAQLNLKYIDIVDGYIEYAEKDAGLRITDDPDGYDKAQREVLEPYERWKLLMGEALQDRNKTIALNKALIALQPRIWEAVYVITHDSKTDIVCHHIWKLNNVITSLMSKYSAFSAEESQNMRGGGWYEQAVKLPY